MNKPLEEAIEYAQKLAALLATLDDREDVPDGMFELDDEDYIAKGDVSVSSNPVSYDLVRSWLGHKVVDAKAYNPGYRFYRKKEGEKWRWLKEGEVLRKGDMGCPKGLNPTLPPNCDWIETINAGRVVRSTDGNFYARRLDAEPAAEPEPEPKYRYDHHIGPHDIGKEVQVRHVGEWKVCGILDEIGCDSTNPMVRFYRIKNSFVKWRHCRIEESQ